MKTEKGIIEEEKAIDVAVSSSSEEDYTVAGEHVQKASEFVPEPVVLKESSAPKTDTSKSLDKQEVNHLPKKELFGQWFNSHSKGFRYGSIVCLVLVLASLVLGLILATKKYPDYLKSFGDKWRYIFDMPNNKLANRMFDDIISERHSYCNYSFFFVDGTRVFREDHQGYYKNVKNYRGKYKNATVYVTQDEVSDKASIITTANYAVQLPKSDTWQIIIGYKCQEQYDSWKEEDPDVRFIRVKKYDMKASFDKVHQLIDQVSEIPVTDPAVVQKIAGYYEFEQNFNKAADVCLLSLKHKKNNPSILGCLALAQYLNAEPSEARASAERALSLDPKECISLQVLSQIEADDFNWGEAKKWARKAIDYGCENAEPYYVYAQALLKQEEKEAARNYYNKAYNINEDSPLAEKYKQCGGCPFEIVSMVFAFVDYNGNIITDYGNKLYSYKSQYIKPKLKLNVLRRESCKIQCKLYCRGKLSTGMSSPKGCSFELDLSFSNTGAQERRLSSWGNSSPGYWPAGAYRFEVWYNGEKIGEERFTIY